MKSRQPAASAEVIVRKAKRAKTGAVRGVPARRRSRASINEDISRHHERQEVDDESRELLEKAVKENRLCSSLTGPEIDLIVKKMEFYRLGPGDELVQQGEEGTHFFVLAEGSIEALVDGQVEYTILPDASFGEQALLFKHEWTCSLVSVEDCIVWAAPGEVFQEVQYEHARKNHAQNLEVVESIRLFDPLQFREKSRVTDAVFLETAEAGDRIIIEGEAATAMYFVKSGKLREVWGSPRFEGAPATNVQEAVLEPGDSFGQHALLYDSCQQSTVEALTRCELYCISATRLQEELGTDLRSFLQRHIALQGLNRSASFSHFSPAQQAAIVRAMYIQDYRPGAVIDSSLEFAVVLDGEISATVDGSQRIISHGHCCGDELFICRLKRRSSMRLDEMAMGSREASNCSTTSEGSSKLLEAGPKGARLGVLTNDCLAKSLSIGGTALQRGRLVALQKVPLFMHLSLQQLDSFACALVSSTYHQGDVVFRQGQRASTFFVVEQGAVDVEVDGRVVRQLQQYSFLGERALLFDEPRTATIRVASAKAVLCSIDKPVFEELMESRLCEQLMNHIRLQDSKNVELKELQAVRVIGQGAFGCVRLVEHCTTKMRYALKKVKKTRGRVQLEVKRECAILASLDHFFTVYLVKTFESSSSIYMLTELLTGGDLYTVIRMQCFYPRFTRAQAQFYIGSLILALEALGDRHIIYRDLKPENVMLDSQGYVKIIDFGTAKVLGQQKDKTRRTFTMVGTLHYMAPEILSRGGYGLEVDLWSLGVMLFELVCGELPFGNPYELDDALVKEAVLRAEVAFPADYDDELGRELINGLLCRQPERRLGAGAGGFHDLKTASYFAEDEEEEDLDDCGALFERILGRTIEPPYVPKGEIYDDNLDATRTLSDYKLLHVPDSRAHTVKLNGEPDDDDSSGPCCLGRGGRCHAPATCTVS